jgi:hypothetical protein
MVDAVWERTVVGLVVRCGQTGSHSRVTYPQASGLKLAFALMNSSSYTCSHLGEDDLCLQALKALQVEP